jgi:hypothetical protein
MSRAYFIFELARNTGPVLPLPAQAGQRCEASQADSQQ